YVFACMEYPASPLRTSSDADKKATKTEEAGSVWRCLDEGNGLRALRARGKDCQPRALATALGTGYAAAWDLLYRMQGQRRACSFTLVDDLRIKDPRLGVVRELEIAKRGLGCT